MSIFESPDKGETVYKRDTSSLDRELVATSLTRKMLDDQIKEDALWRDIRRKAKTNVALCDILDQAVMIYNLIKDEKRN
jgi:hypothetical protein